MQATTIAIISPMTQALMTLSQKLKRIPQVGEVITIQGDLKTQPDLPDPVDVVIAADSFEERRSLEVLAQFGMKHPRTSLVLCSRQNSPDFLIQAMRSGVREVISPEVSDEDLGEVILRLNKQHSKVQDQDGKVMAFISCKGGGGATFLATNLGYTLASQQGKRVTVIDLNLQFGDAALFVSDQRPSTHLGELSQQSRHLDASLLSAAMLSVLPHFGVLAAPDHPSMATDIQAGQIRSIIRLAKSHYDYVILDIGRSLDIVGLTALEMSDHIFPILQNTIPYLRDGKRLMDLFHSLGYPNEKIYPVLNRHDKDSEITLQHLEKALSKKILRTIPNHYAAVAASVNQGIPVVKLAKSSPVAKALCDWATQISGKRSPPSRNWITRILH